MEIEWSVFIASLVSNPILIAVTLLNIGVIIVNGATDAPNAIATVVSTRCMKAGPAIIMAAVCNFLGLVLISLVSAAVADTIFNMVDFGGDSHQAIVALMAAMVAIIVWGGAAWYFGIPTSQSHSLIAGLTGAAIALQGGFGGVNWMEWLKVIYGILLSTFMGFATGWLASKLVVVAFNRVSRRKSDHFFRWAQIVTGASVAFMHGAQDGQKFMGIFLLALALANGQGSAAGFVLPIWMMILCALSMGVGTAVGGKRIIKNVGVDMVKMERHQGFAASLASTVCLVIATFGGLPVSTTHTSTTAIMGVGAARNPKAVKWSIAIDMVKTWVLTFPGCGILGFLVAELFFLVF